MLIPVRAIDIAQYVVNFITSVRETAKAL